MLVLGVTVSSLMFLGALVGFCWLLCGIGDEEGTVAFAKVKAECVGCGETRMIGSGEIPAGDVPMCTQCYVPMVAVAAVGEEDNA